MFSKILRPLTDLARHILSKPDERGNLTSDLFRLKIRGRVEQPIKDNSGFYSILVVERGSYLKPS